MKIGIIDYGMGNLGSVLNACRFLNVEAELIRQADRMDSCGGIILPGQGKFGDCMEHLRGHGFEAPVKEWIIKDRPFLGICIGIQVLFESSEEDPEAPGLGVFPGAVRRFPGGPGLKVPQMGWNRVFSVKDSPLFSDVEDGSYFYFVHSYYVDTPDRDVIAGETEFGVRYVSAVERGRVAAVQFHPEKSQAAGLQVLRNFITTVEAA